MTQPDKNPEASPKDFPHRLFQPSLLTYLAAQLTVSLRSIFPAQKDEFLTIDDSLQEFYQREDPLPIVLSNDIITETLHELSDALKFAPKNLPEITYIVPIFNCDESKIFATLNSLAAQIGVKVIAILVVDGPNENDLKAVQSALSSLSKKLDYILINRTRNGGVSKARNTGMKLIKTPYFSWLDSHDIIHPLRSLHAILYLNNKGIERLNTGYSRACLNRKKIYIRNWRMHHCGHTSFVSRTHLLQKFGYLMDMRNHEDTEYQKRLEYFKAEMHYSSLVGHYLDLSINDPTAHLSSDTWNVIDAADNHPIIGGTYQGTITDERQRSNAQALNLYDSALKEMAQKYFPCIE